MKMMICIALNKNIFDSPDNKKNQVTKTRKNIKLLSNFVYPNAQNKKSKVTHIAKNQGVCTVQWFGVPRILSR